METILKYFLPIGAFAISIVSLLVSFFNSRFNKRFEAAKKRNEIHSLLSDNWTTFEIKSMQYHLALGVCKGCEECPKATSEMIRSHWLNLLKGLRTQWYRLEKSISPDPIELENFLLDARKGFAEVSVLMAKIDEFIDKSKECAEKAEKDSSKS